jgi:hypothetical protein
MKIDIPEQAKIIPTEHCKYPHKLEEKKCKMKQQNPYLHPHPLPLITRNTAPRRNTKQELERNWKKDMSQSWLHDSTSVSFSKALRTLYPAEDEQVRPGRFD